MYGNVRTVTPGEGVEKAWERRKLRAGETCKEETY
jgi:hypothetical protein